MVPPSRGYVVAIVVLGFSQEQESIPPPPYFIDAHCTLLHTLSCLVRKAETFEALRTTHVAAIDGAAFNVGTWLRTVLGFSQEQELG